MATKKVPTSTIELISPTQAEQFLTKNKVNRRIRNRKVSEYANDIQRGLWRLTGDAITFDTSGNLIQGQHRLSACIEAGKPFETFVIRDVQPNAQDVMDTGARRSVADVLHMRGEANAIVLSALIRQEALFRKDPQLRSQDQQSSNISLLQIFDENPDMWRNASRVGGTVANFLKAGTGTVFGWTWTQINAINPQDCDAFFELIKTGDGLGKGDPIFALRRALLNQEGFSSLGDRRRAFAMIFKAWNLWREGVSAQIIAFRSGGPQPEKMPEPK